jgi:RHH-type proline utilization regulon transcriptional repressor/proline dehydrogenase/delta 1-pyrroline-5-carboxylate dehydrogenase
MPLFTRKKTDRTPPPAITEPKSTAGAARPSNDHPDAHAAPKVEPNTESSSEPNTEPNLEPRIFEIGADMLEKARGHKAGVLSAKFYSDKLMNWSMKDHDFKVQMFRFVDTFPMLRSPEMIHDHLVDYLSQPGVTLPSGMEFGLKASGIAKGLAAKTISGQINGMAQKFIAGVDAKSALPGLRKLWNDDIAFSVDLLGEACVSDAEADMYQRKYLDLIDNLPKDVEAWPDKPALTSDHMGAIPRTNVSVKISSLSAKCDPIDTEGAIADLMTRLRPILERARDRGVFVNFDMESDELKDLTIELFQHCCEEVDFQAGLAMQAYLRSGVEDAQRMCDWARRTGRIVTVRLVKGAYWDYETIHAEEQGWPCPVWAEKWQTDHCFEQMTRVFLDNHPKLASGSPDLTALGPTRQTPGAGGVKLALGSHNVRSIAACLAMMEGRGIPRHAIELQMLHGMADELKHAASDLDLRIREYVPVGEMIPGMAYLVRRLLENTSNESWLLAGFRDKADPKVLLANPARPNGTARRQTKQDLSEVAPERHNLSSAPTGVGDGRPFFNEPTHDFARRDKRKTFALAIEKATVPTVANDKTPQDAARMIEEAHRAFPDWRDADPKLRADVLIRAAAAMRKRRDEISGIMIKEAGKTWREADADTCEAIDFCDYYAREAVHLFARRRLGKFIGELDELWHQPRGVAAVISPWNFPCAILTGMTAAALVSGNTVILKPAEQTPGIAKIVYDILQDALREVFDTPSTPSSLRRSVASVLHFCPAPGETTGAAIVRDPRIALIAFTGSKAVGLDIIQAAGVTPEQQHHVKKVVCEMGGKNAAIVDVSADLDEAVLGLRYSAFGFQGQKCSACSRIVVVDPAGPDGEHITTFLSRFVESTRSLIVGDPIKSGTDVAHVIDEAAASNIRRYIELAKSEGCEVALAMAPSPLNDKTPPNLPSEFVPRTVGPHIFSRVTPDHTIAKEEIFGPVVAVMHAKTFDEALAIANGSIYKLTGGVFTRKPAHIEKAKREFRVGNLYINRGTTGALVARQPFGGFGMSGVGSKAGGPDYLLQFVEPRACCENTMRRGFAPEL